MVEATPDNTPQGTLRSSALTRVPGRSGGLGTARPRSGLAAHLRRGARGETLRSLTGFTEPERPIRRRQVAPFLAEKLAFIDGSDRRQVEGYGAAMPRLIEGRRDRERLAVTVRGPVEDFIEAFEQVITSRMLLHQVAAGGNVNAVVGSSEHRRRRRRAGGYGRFGRRHGGRLRVHLVEMHMDVHGGSGACRCRGWSLINRARLLLRRALLCSSADVAGELFEEEGHRADDGKGQFRGEPENELNDIHL